MRNLKPQQRLDLTYKFGLTTQPIAQLTFEIEPPNTVDYRIAVAKIEANSSLWNQDVRSFCTFASDVVFEQECREMSRVLRLLLRSVSALASQSNNSDRSLLQRRVSEEVQNAKDQFFQILDRIPVEWEAVVFQANTPFTAYLRIKEAVDSAKLRVDYFDRYLKPDFFQLFLASMPRTVSVRLVTTAGKQTFGVAAVRAVSQLVAVEFDDFQLIEVVPDLLHDRNLRVDQQIFSLGPGVDRAGMSLTNFGPTEISDAVHQALDCIIAKGVVVS